MTGMEDVKSEIEPAEPTVELTPRERALAELVVSMVNQGMAGMRQEMYALVSRAEGAVAEMQKQQEAQTDYKIHQAATLLAQQQAAHAAMTEQVVAGHTGAVSTVAQIANAAAVRATAAAEVATRAAASVPATPGAVEQEGVRGLAGAPPGVPPVVHVVTTTLPPLPASTFQRFIGNDPAVEKVSPVAFLRQFDMMRNLHPYTDAQLIIMAAQNFKAEGYAAIWWQVQMQEYELTGEMPFKTWADFRTAFLEGMRVYDEGTGVRMAMEGLRMQGDNLVEYIATFRGHLVRLEAIKQPLNPERAVFDFCKGLPQRLREKCPLAAGVTFNTAVARVLEAYRKMQMNHRMRDLSTRQGNRLNNLEVEDEGYYQDAWDEGYLAEEDEGWYDEEQEVHLASMNVRGRGRGRGRG